MALDTKHEDLKNLRIERPLRNGAGEPPAWARRFILGGIAFILLLGMAALGYRLAQKVPEVEVARAMAQDDKGGEIILSASGYIVAHHKINVNSKVTGRVSWVGVEKGDKVNQGQILVRLEDEEFRAQCEQARGAVESAKARLLELENGSRPEEIRQAEHNLAEARATLANDKATLDRTSNLTARGVLPRQSLDDAMTRYEAGQQRVASLEQSFRLARIGPRPEAIARARGDLLQAEGQLAYAKSQLDATVIRAPVRGTILERKVEKGELITAQFASGAEGGPQGSVVALADLKDLQVELDIAQDDFAKLGPREKGRVTTDAFPDRKYDGVIAEISPEANRQKATVQVKVQVINPDDYLRPEMNATVKFLASERKSPGPSSGIWIPASALRERDGRKVVFLVFNGKALMREVRIVGQRTGGYLVSGLTGGENVITSAVPNLQEGQELRIKGES